MNDFFPLYTYVAQLAKDAGLKLEQYHPRLAFLPDRTIRQKDFDYIKRIAVFQYL